MGLDDRDWMRRESEERRQEGRARGRPRGLRLNVLHLFAGLILLIVLTLTWSSLREFVERLTAPFPAEESAPFAEAPEELPTTPPVPVAAQRRVPSDNSVRPSIRDCLNGGNVIDENVIRCQNGGELPRRLDSQTDTKSTGMVSPEYLAKFQAERDRRIRQGSGTRNVTQERDSKWIKSWDGGSSYLAEWIVINNVIDGGTVCRNQGWGSIEYRECRKGAKVYFREQCRVWENRAGRDRKEWSYRMKERYCTAESSFSPMG